MSRVRAYGVRRLDGREFPVGPLDFHYSELSRDRRIFWCIDIEDAKACAKETHYGPVEIVEGWTSILDWSESA